MTSIDYLIILLPIAHCIFTLTILYLLCGVLAELSKLLREATIWLRKRNK